MEGLSLKKIYALIREDLKSLSVYDFMRLWKILFEFLKEKVIEQLNKEANELIAEEQNRFDNQATEIENKLQQFPRLKNRPMLEGVPEPEELHYEIDLGNCPKFYAKPEVEGLPEGISFTVQGETIIFTGRPNIKESFNSPKNCPIKVKLYFDLSSCLETLKQKSRLYKQTEDVRYELELSGNITVLQHPANLWDEKECLDKQYEKAHSAFNQILFEKEDGIVFAVSKRGRQHAKLGKYRDDGFYIDFDKSTGWYFLAVADGAGSAKYSREGSKIACTTAVAELKNRLTSPNYVPNALEGKTETKEDLIKEALLFRKKKADGKDAKPFDQKTFHAVFYDVVVGSAFEAKLAIEKEAKEKGFEPKDYATTLLLAGLKKFGDEWAILSYWVGDGAFALYTQGQQVTLLGEPDEGKFSGETCFLTMPEAFSNQKNRLKFSTTSDFTSLLLMSDGVSDAKFGSSAALEDLNNWDKLWSDLALRLDEGSIEEALLKWCSFYVEGEHDDRTLALFLPNKDELALELLNKQNGTPSEASDHEPQKTTKYLPVVVEQSKEQIEPDFNKPEKSKEVSKELANQNEKKDPSESFLGKILNGVVSPFFPVSSAQKNKYKE